MLRHPQSSVGSDRPCRSRRFSCAPPLTDGYFKRVNPAFQETVGHTGVGDTEKPRSSIVSN